VFDLYVTIYIQDASDIVFDDLWNPSVYIENTLQGSQVSRSKSIEMDNKKKLYVVEVQTVRGFFVETMDLSYFPLDTQVKKQHNIFKSQIVKVTFK